MPSYERYVLARWIVRVLNLRLTRPQARRLGVMVPGIPGYISMRDRANMQWTKSDGTQNPDWWEVEAKSEGMNEKVANAGSGSGHDTDTDDAALVSRLFQESNSITSSCYLG